MKKTTQIIITVSAAIAAAIGIFKITPKVFVPEKELGTLELFLNMEDNQNDLKIVERRLDYAGLKYSLKPIGLSGAHLTIESIPREQQVNRILTDNISMDVWEIAPYTQYVDLKDTTDDFNKTVHSIFTVYDYEELSGTYSAIGCASLEDTSLVGMAFREVYDNIIPLNIKYVWKMDPFSEDLWELYPLLVQRNGNPPLSINEYLLKAEAEGYADSDSYSFAELRLILSPQGGKIFSSLTQDNLAKYLAFTVNNEVWDTYYVEQAQDNGEILFSCANNSGKYDIQTISAILNGGKTGGEVSIIEQEYTPYPSSRAIWRDIRSIGALCLLVMLLLYCLYSLAITAIGKADKGRVIFWILCTLFVLISTVMFATSIPNANLNMMQLVTAIMLAIATIAFCFKSTVGWYLMTSYWILLILTAISVTYLDRLLFTQLLILIAIAVPVIAMLISVKIRKEVFCIDKSPGIIAGIIAVVTLSLFIGIGVLSGIIAGLLNFNQ